MPIGNSSQITNGQYTFKGKDLTAAMVDRREQTKLSDPKLSKKLTAVSNNYPNASGRKSGKSSNAKT